MTVTVFLVSLCGAMFLGMPVAWLRLGKYRFRIIERPLTPPVEKWFGNLKK